MKRGLGLLLIIRALTPLLAVLTIFWALNQVGSGFQEYLAGPLGNLKTDASSLRQVIDNAWQDFNSAAGGIRTAATRLTSFHLPNLSSDQLGVLLGGLAGPVNSLFRGIERVFQPFGGLLNTIGEFGGWLQVFPDDFNQIVNQGQAALDNLNRVVARWSGWLIAAAILILILVAVYNLSPMLDDFRRGWQTLFGLPRAP
jgi:hypothetical protein